MQSRCSIYMLLFYFCVRLGVGGVVVEKFRLKLTSAKVEAEVEAELGKNNLVM